GAGLRGGFVARAARAALDAGAGGAQDQRRRERRARRARGARADEDDGVRGLTGDARAARRGGPDGYSDLRRAGAPHGRDRGLASLALARREQIPVALLELARLRLGFQALGDVVDHAEARGRAVELEVERHDLDVDLLSVLPAMARDALHV